MAKLEKPIAAEPAPEAPVEQPAPRSERERPKAAPQPSLLERNAANTPRPARR